MIERCYLVDRASRRLMRITILDGRFVAGEAWRRGRWRRADLAAFVAWLYREDVEEIAEREALRAFATPA